MSKWKKIKTKVEEVNSKLGLFNSNETNLTPTKLKRKIGKRNFYKDIRFYIVSSYIISLFVGFCIYFSQRKNYLFNYNIVQTLTGWAFGFFTLSISIYALILKFTKSTTLSNYIQKNVKVKSITIIFSMIYITEIILLIHFITNIIEISYATQWSLFIIPLILLMLMTIGKIIVPLLLATTTIQSIFFFEKYAEIIKNDFTRHYQKQLKNSEMKLKRNLEEIRKSKKGKVSNLYQVMKLNLENLGSIQLGVTAKNFDNYFKKINSDALNIMFEIRDSSKYADSKIFEALGRIASPPYISYNFVRDNIVLKLNLVLEENIEYDSCILDFLEGFTTESLKSPNIEGIMAYELESILDIIQKIGYSKIKTKKQSYLYDKAFHFYLKISEIITDLIKNQKYNPGNPLQRMIERIGRIESSFLTSNKVLQGVQLYRIKELIKLEIPLQLKLILFKMVKEVINRIDRVDLSGPYIFSIFQEIFPSILKSQLLDNLNYDLSKIKENDIRIENENKIYTKNGIIYGAKYSTTLLRWLDETIEYLFNLYNKYIQRLDEKKMDALSHPLIEQLNRIFIDLVTYLYTLKSTSKFDANFFIEENVIRLINKLIELGDKIQQNTDTKFDLCYLLAPSIVILDYIIQNNPDSEVLKIIKKNKNDFTLLIKVSLNIISRSRINEDIFFLEKKTINEKKELIEKSFLDKYEMPMEHFKAKKFLMGSIETRPGSWKVVGHQIGYYIGNLSSILSNEQEILKYISNSV